MRSTCSCRNSQSIDRDPTIAFSKALKRFRRLLNGSGAFAYVLALIEAVENLPSPTEPTVHALYGHTAT
jgi:hypothetical protein